MVTGKFKLLAPIIGALVLGGCAITEDTSGSANAIHDETSVVRGNHAGGELRDADSQNEFVQPLPPVLLVPELPMPEIEVDAVRPLDINEIISMIIEDFKKREMLLDMECASAKSPLDGKINYPKVNEVALLGAVEDVDGLIAELGGKIQAASVAGDQEMMDLYQQEISRINLEYSIARNEALLQDYERQLEAEIQRADKESSVHYECKLKKAELKAEMDRQVDMAKMSNKIQEAFSGVIEETRLGVEESTLELDELNAEMFDGILML